MPRYHFNLFNDVTALDEEGVTLPNAGVALQRAKEFARFEAGQSVLKGHLILDHRIEVADEEGKPVGTVRFSDVVAVKKSATSA